LGVATEVTAYNLIRSNTLDPRIRLNFGRSFKKKQVDIRATFFTQTTPAPRGRNKQVGYFNYSKFDR